MNVAGWWVGDDAAHAVLDVSSQHWDLITSVATEGSDVRSDCYLLYAEQWRLCAGELNLRAAFLRLSFVIVFVGVGLALTGARAAFSMTGGETGVLSGATLRTSSPGLVLVVVGATMLAFTIQRKVDVDFAPRCIQAGESAGMTPEEKSIVFDTMIDLSNELAELQRVVNAGAHGSASVNGGADPEATEPDEAIEEAP